MGQRIFQCVRIILEMGLSSQCGKDDFVMESNKRLLEMLKKLEMKHEYFESPGSHTWANWRTYLSIFAPMLFNP